MESLGIITLPAKIEQKTKAKQKKIQWTDRTNEPDKIESFLDELMPISLQIVTEKDHVAEWNEFVDRYHPASRQRSYFQFQSLWLTLEWTCTTLMLRPHGRTFPACAGTT